ncbi:MAG: flagellar type III secretion system pore protein FliP, partial [Oscillospiraceae bacterium]
EIIIMLSLITLIPSILMLMTCFTRIIIVLSFLRNALGIQQAPPNQVLIGIALFLTLFIMAPVFSEINQNAYTPYKEEKITQEQFLKEASVSMKKFMIKQAKKEDINLFIDLSKTEIKTVGENGQKLTNNEILMELPMTTIIPAFVTSELKRAFTMGFFIFLPFLLIDMVVSSVLMSMGMVMLPPAMISLPFKLLLFVLVDGWGLLMQTLVKSFIQ